jgi:hypothetical protein
VSWVQREFVSLEKSVQSWHHVLLLFRSLDHPVRSRQYVRRDRENDLLRRLQIDDEFELRRLLDGKLGRVDSLQDSVHVICDAPVAVRARQTGDRLLFFWVRGRPRGRKVLLSPNLLAVSACHSEEENRKIVVIVMFRPDNLP